MGDSRGDRLVVLGASAGGIEAIRQVLQELPTDLPAAVAVVVHLSPLSHGGIADALARGSAIPVALAEDGAELQPGHALVAPPDRHLVVERARVCITTGPRENGFRPAVDTLFRSAAVSWGERAIGVVLSGMLDDGAFGLRSIVNAGGVGLVQDPATALHGDMPHAAIAAGGATGVHPLVELADAISAAARHSVSEEHPMSTVSDDEPVVDSEEIDGEMIPAVCPSCGGNLWEHGSDGGTGGPAVQFRCRTGHRFSPDSLVEIQGTEVEDALWGAYRALLERADMTRRLARRFSEGGMERSERRWTDIADEAERRAKVLRTVLDGP